MGLLIFNSEKKPKLFVDLKQFGKKNKTIWYFKEKIIQMEKCLRFYFAARYADTLSEKKSLLLNAS